MAAERASPGSRWCWVVAIASFWTNFCLLGVLRSSAVVYVAFVDTFGVSRENAAWPSGVFGFTMCLTGAFSGCVSQYIKIRNIMMVAAIFAALSVSLCCCATHMNHIIIFYGAFQGIGIGMIVPLTHVILNEHFVKKRAVAMGIAYAGSSAGSFVFPAVAQMMIVEYGLPGTFLLLGGIMLNSVLGIALFRDSTQKSISNRDDDTQKIKLVIQDGNRVERKSSPQRKNCQGHKSKSWSSLVGDYTTLEKDERKQAIGDDDLSSIKKIKENEGNWVCGSAKKLHFSQDHLEKLKAVIELAFQVLVHPSFLTFSLVFAVYFSASAIFLMIIVDHGLDLGYTKRQGVFLVSAFSFGDLVGRLACGWIADLKFFNRRHLVTGYLVIMGAMLMTMPLCHSYEVLMVLSVMMGLLNGSVIVNYSVILTENIGLQKLAMAMGFSTFIIGSSAFLRPIFVGYFRDKSQNYDLLFVCLGGLQIGITVIWLLESTLRRRRQPGTSSL